MKRHGRSQDNKRLRDWLIRAGLDPDHLPEVAQPVTKQRDLRKEIEADQAIALLLKAGIDPDILSALLQWSGQMENGRLRGVPAKHLLALVEYEKRSNAYQDVMQDLSATFAAISVSAMHLERGGKKSVSAEILKPISTHLAGLHERWKLAYRQIKSWNRPIDPDNIPEDCKADISIMEDLVRKHTEAIHRLVADGDKSEMHRLLDSEYTNAREILKSLHTIDDIGGRTPSAGIAWIKRQWTAAEGRNAYSRAHYLKTWLTEKSKRQKLEPDEGKALIILSEPRDPDEWRQWEKNNIKRKGVITSFEP